MQRLAGEIGSLLDDLCRDRAIDPETQAEIQLVADLYRTVLQDQILTVLCPLLWKMRCRIWAVTRAQSDSGLKIAVDFFASSTFAERVARSVREICVDARRDSMECQRRGLAQQASGLSLFLPKDETLERQIYPSVGGFLHALTKKATEYEPNRDRSFVRLCVRMADILDALSKLDE